MNQICTLNNQTLFLINKLQKLYKKMPHLIISILINLGWIKHRNHLSGFKAKHMINILNKKDSLKMFKKIEMIYIWMQMKYFRKYGVKQWLIFLRKELNLYQISNCLLQNSKIDKLQIRAKLIKNKYRIKKLQIMKINLKSS